MNGQATTTAVDLEVDQQSLADIEVDEETEQRMWMEAAREFFAERKNWWHEGHSIAHA